VPKVSGGGNYYAPTCLVEICDTLTDSWETELPLPVASGLVGAVTVERKIYVLVGETSQFFVFDVDQNKWTELARIPVDANTGSFGMVASEGKIYVVRGSGNYPSGIYWTYCYDPQTNSWT
jgi:N-acetylneuraminic acid mutarotase